MSVRECCCHALEKGCLLQTGTVPLWVHHVHLGVESGSAKLLRVQHPGDDQGQKNQMELMSAMTLPISIHCIGNGIQALLVSVTPVRVTI